MYILMYIRTGLLHENVPSNVRCATAKCLANLCANKVFMYVFMMFGMYMCANVRPRYVRIRHVCVYMYIWTFYHVTSKNFGSFPAQTKYVLVYVSIEMLCMYIYIMHGHSLLVEILTHTRSLYM